jgi:large subunit ribosomal protein L18
MKKTRQQQAQIRHRRARRKIRGTPQRPRLCLHKSGKHLYAQVIDDTQGQTLLSATTNLKAHKTEAKAFCNIAWAERLGADLGRKAVERGLTQVVFDRGGARYHGVVRAFADAARAAGLKF